jgi:transcriptional regulator with XRE-family HTH domain/tetratricopeptide (TPR) repeat protein
VKASPRGYETDYTHTIVSPHDGQPSYGALLRRFRSESGLSQEELAEAAGVSVRTIRNLESGQVLPQRRTTDEVVRALALNVPQRDLLLSSLKEHRRPRLAEYRAERSLPRDVTDFVGRRAELEQLQQELEHSASSGPRVVLVSGQAGVGKTSMVLHAAHQLSDRAISVDLRGVDAVPLATTDALAQLLTAFGIRAEHVPASLDIRLALYRALTSERDGLLVLDNAGHADQVRVLLPTGSKWRVLITSRNTLPMLDRTRRIALDIPSEDEALAMLRGIVGAGRLAGEPEAAAELVELCGRLPLAIRLVGSRLLSRPRWTIASWTQQMRERHRRLDLLRAGDVSVRSAIRLSYDQLSPELRRMLRLVASLPWPSVSAVEAAALAGATPAAAESMLASLVSAGLLSDAVAQGHQIMHDLVRLFATEQPEPDLEAAHDRLCAWLVATFDAASFRLAPDTTEAPSGRFVSDDPLAMWFADPAEAVDWLDTELHAWAWALARLAAQGKHPEVVGLMRNILPYLTRRPHFSKLEEVCTTAITSAIELGKLDLEGLLRGHYAWNLSVAHERHAEALDQYALALDALSSTGNLFELATTHLMLGTSAAMSGDLPTALASLEAADECLRQPGAVPPDDPTRLSLQIQQYIRGALLSAISRFDEAITVLGSSARLWDAAPVDRLVSGLGAGRARQLLGAALMSIGHWDAAVKELDAAQRILAEVHDPHGVALSTLALGRALSQVDRAQAVETLRTACEVTERNTDTLGHIVALKALGDVLEPGDPERKAVLRRVRALCEAMSPDLSPAPIKAIRTAMLAESDEEYPNGMATAETSNSAKPTSVHWM